MTPQKFTPNELLSKHGPTGWLIRRLQRYALLGWGLFFFVLVAFFLIVALSTLTPRPVVAVDAAGRVLGTIEYINADSRTDDEIVATAMRFAKLNMSLNSETIFEDYAESMNMMDNELMEQTTAFVKSSGYLAKVRAAKTRSRLEFSREIPPAIIERRGMFAWVRLAGDIVVDTGDKGGEVSKPFDITVQTKIVARNTGNTAGLVIVTKKDN